MPRSQPSAQSDLAVIRKADVELPERADLRLAAPPVEAMPRISNSPIPGPLVRIETPGTDCTRLSRLASPA